MEHIFYAFTALTVHVEKCLPSRMNANISFIVTTLGPLSLHLVQPQTHSWQERGKGGNKFLAQNKPALVVPVVLVKAGQWLLVHTLLPGYTQRVKRLLTYKC